MKNISKGLSALVGVIHVYFCYVEMFTWTTPRALEVFSMTLEKAQSSAVLAANQGVYNFMLGLGLIAAAFMNSESSKSVRKYLLFFVAVVGIYGAITVTSRIFYLQTLPALIAMATIFVFEKPEAVKVKARR